MNRELYLDLVQKCILGLIYQDGSTQNPVFDENERTNGLAWPLQAHSMIGAKRMNNIQELAQHVIDENIPGDFAETGVWRGGACIFMAAILKAYNITNRSVWVCDSFAGLPPPNIVDYPQDAGDSHHSCPQLAISLETVQSNFARYNLLSDQIKFVKGFFSDTLPTAPIEQLSILRLDGDMYESTIVALENLYLKLSIGGYVIVDDYFLPNCRRAIEDYMSANNIKSELIAIDSSSVYWKK